MKISTQEAADFIENDQTGILESHRGFLSKPDLPFRPPEHYKNGVVIWPPVDIHPAAKIGSGVIIGRYTNICGDITIGEKTRIQGFCFIPSNVEIGKRVFIGPNVTFTNIKYPQVRSDRWRPNSFDGRTVIEDGVSIGAGVVICPGVRIGKNTLVGAGAVVTKDILPDIVVVGCPAVKHKEL